MGLRRRRAGHGGSSELGRQGGTACGRSSGCGAVLTAPPDHRSSPPRSARGRPWRLPWCGGVELVGWSGRGHGRAGGVACGRGGGRGFARTSPPNLRGDGKPGHVPGYSGLVTASAGESHGVTKARPSTTTRLPSAQSATSVWTPSSSACSRSAWPSPFTTPTSTPISAAAVSPALIAGVVHLRGHQPDGGCHWPNTGADDRAEVVCVAQAGDGRRAAGPGSLGGSATTVPTSDRRQPTVALACRDVRSCRRGAR
ncbi:hypothetical protein CLV40_123107 [Actinokineospora auranticolor]|uniref:Uncharacterized protein n=1 Tax=Actinokineospora auranticolor TaxID=155976 RepID=A0A2S6GFJ0_9PSEU|nr:hypothetical protein CLV40_123107 [Actinokineospora auranticolor]